MAQEVEQTGHRRLVAMAGGKRHEGIVGLQQKTSASAMYA